MIRFNNDYNHGAFESILNGLAATNTASYAGYGEDEWCARAEDDIKKLISKIYPRRNAGEYSCDLGGTLPDPERYCGRYRTYKLP